MAFPFNLTQLGRYRLDRKLGDGGMGVVYQATDTTLSRQVAVKIPLFQGQDDPVNLERFRREAQLAASIDHPNICRVLDFGEDQGFSYLVMPLLSGQPLDKHIVPNRPWPAQTAVSLVRKLAAAVQVLHDHDVIHRDLKPANIMLQPNGEPIILDLGIARSMKGQHTQLTNQGDMLGTIPWMSPEQANRESDLGPSTDVYSLGVILYELLTGRLPYWADQLQALLTLVLLGPPAPLPSQIGGDCDPRLDAICLKAIERNRDARYQTAKELGDALQSYLQTRPVTLGIQIPLPAADGPPSLQKSLFQKATILPGPPIVGEVGSVPQVAEQTNSLGMRLRHFPPGKFAMGSPPAEIGRSDQEKPHEVELTQPFYLSIHLITQEQFERVMGYHPSHFSVNGVQRNITTKYLLAAPAGGSQRLKHKDTRLHPVENLSWDEAVEFCDKLSALPDEKRAGRIYRLPTEAEWEYACRGGIQLLSAAPFCYGASLCAERANFDGRYPYPDSATKGTYHAATVAVGSYPPSPTGLYDLHGNVAEWCQDWYAKDYYRISPKIDPPGPAKGSTKVVRGGAWVNVAKLCRTACRGESDPIARSSSIGFRVAMTVRKV